MFTSASRRRDQLPQRIARGGAFTAIALGAVVLCGYARGERGLVGEARGGPPVPPLTAVALVLAGAGLLLVVPKSGRPWRRRLGQAVGVVVAAIASTVLIEYITGLVIVDDVLFAGQAHQWAKFDVPGRPSLHTAVGFILVGLSLVLLDTNAARAGPIGRWLVPATLLVSATVVLGDIYGAGYVRIGSPHLPGTSPFAGLGLLVLGVGIMLCRPNRPPGHVFAGRGPGGRTMRRLAPSVTVILLGAVLLTATGQMGIPVDVGLAATAATAMVIVSLYSLFVRAGAAMDTADRKLRNERDYVRTVLHSLREGVITVTAEGKVLRVTPRWCQITGYAERAVIGISPPYPWGPSEPATLDHAGMEPIAAPNPQEFDAVIVRPDGTRVDVLLTVSLVRDQDGGLTTVTTYRDLTERKAAEAERQRIADQVDHFFEMSGDLLCIFGRDGFFKRLNPAWERALGFTANELMSRRYTEFLHPDDVERTQADAKVTAESRTQMANFENRYRCRDGSYRWLSWSATLAEDDAAVYGVARDITAQREAERSQAFLAAIVGGTDDAVIGKTLDGTIVSWNDAAERMYGYSAAEAVGQSIRILTAPEQADEFSDILERIRSGSPVVRHDNTRRRKDGSRVHVSLTISPISDTTGTIIGAASIARDVTAQIAAEQRFQRLVQAAPDAMIIVDDRGKIALANDQTGRLFGYPSDELIGVSVEQLVPSGVRERHIYHREHYLSAPHNLLMGSGMELSGLRRDGSEFPIEISLAPLQTDEGTMISGAIRDISKRRDVEQALASARDDALVASKLKSQFVAMVSHEIRTPMNGVIGLSGLLLGTALSSDQKRYAEAIRTSGRALLTIINDILDFSKIEAGKINLVATDFDLAELLDTVTEVAAEGARGKDVEIVCYYPPDLPAVVRGDDGRVRQTLLNLAGNAVKFTERGRVILRADPAPQAGDGMPRVTFTVTDTGVGMAARDLPRLFEPFTQADAATSREFGGTGLGLTISRQLVDLMGGELTAESEVGAGSRFAFTIPFALPAQPSGDRSPSPLPGCSLLVVDAHPDRRRLIVEHTRAWGHAVTEATDGRQVRDALAVGRYDVVVVDNRALARDADLAAVLGGVVRAGTSHLVVLSDAAQQGDLLPPFAQAAHLVDKPVGVGRLRDCLQQLLAPRAEPSDRAGQVSPDPVADLCGRILLAEDNPINQLVAEDLLEVLGFDCDIAQNGLEVLRLAAANPYQAILMDCQMPKMDGFAAASALRERETPDQHVPIIALTAGALAEDRAHCIAAGMDDYLVKPIDPDLLRAALERWTGGTSATLTDPR